MEIIARRLREEVTARTVSLPSASSLSNITRSRVRCRVVGLRDRRPWGSVEDGVHGVPTAHVVGGRSPSQVGMKESQVGMKEETKET